MPARIMDEQEIGRLGLGPGISRPNPNEDYVYRMQERARRRRDRPTTFKNDKVMVDFGPEATKCQIVLRHAEHVPYIERWDEDAQEVVREEAPKPERSYVFACIDENRDWLDRPEAEWRSVAGTALIKFAAGRGRRIMMGPRAEDSNPYNVMIEIEGAV